MESNLKPNPNPKNEKTFSCPVCGRSHKTFNNLVAHMSTRHGSVEFIVRKNPDRVELLKGGSSPISNFLNAQPQSQVISQPKPQTIHYEDWSGALETLKKAYNAGLFVLIIGPKGTGKTTLVRRFAEMVGKKLYTVNFSLRTKESHLIGMQVLENGNTKFASGVVAESMKEGAILYLDELNTAEPDVLLRLDEALDDRRELNIKEAGEPVVIKAKPGWFVIATINPLSHAGTKELPPQLLSRFPVRLYLDYPPNDVELKIVRLHVGELSTEETKWVNLAIALANKLRELARVEELYYGPSLRETIAFAKLIKAGVEPRTAAEMVFANAYWQWGQVAYSKVMNLVVSLFGEKSK